MYKATRSPFAREVVEAISVVYAIEKRIRGRAADARHAARQSESRPIMTALHARFLAVRDGLSQKSTLAKAVDYPLGHWGGLPRFLDDGRIEPDTNIVERPITPIALGRKNSLFSGDEGGAETWAILSTLINAAKLQGIDPEIWLTDVLERVVYDQRPVQRPSGVELEGRAQADPDRGVIADYRKAAGSAAVSASAVSAWIASRISRSVVCSK